MNYTPEFVWRYWAKVDRRGDDECWPWLASTAGKGYGQMRIPGTRKNAYSHRAAYEITYGEVPTGMEICHRCDNPACCNPKHLFVGTRKDNAQDMAKKGRGLWGSKNPMAKADAEKVRLIFDLNDLGYSQGKIGKVVGLHQVQVGRILNNKRWQQLKVFGPKEG